MTTLTPAFKQIASGLRFPEGPVAMPDGSVILVEIERRTLSRVTPDGKIHVIAKLGGGPNGAAMGLWHRLLGGQRPSMGDYVTGPGAPTGAGGAGGRSC